MTPLSLAVSPCPNDTFTFHALVHGLVPGAPPVRVTYADVDVTNTAAERGEFDLVKVSYAALPWLLDAYELLPCGGALGRGCGPLVLTREGHIGGRDAAVDLSGATVAVPGDRTTAYLLFRFWAAQTAAQAGAAQAGAAQAGAAQAGAAQTGTAGAGAAQTGTAGAGSPPRIETVPFHEIMPGVAAGRYDAGLVIHEARFVYPRYGLTALVDLGEWWEGETGLPIPLGAILARRPGPGRDGVDPATAAEWIRASVRYAWAHPAASREYVLAHAQEMEPDVVARHIDLYVNSFTEDLGEEGHAAVRALLDRAAAAGLTPPAGSTRAAAGGTRAGGGTRAAADGTRAVG